MEYVDSLDDLAYITSLENRIIELKKTNSDMADENAKLREVLQMIVDRSVTAGQDSCGWEMSKVRSALLEFAECTLKDKWDSK